MIEYFALFVIFVVAATIVGALVVLGMMPGKIARSRNHPQAEAISVCGWWGVLTIGLLLPLAYVWAYTVPDTSGDNERELDDGELGS